LNFESVENVRSSNVLKFEFTLRHIPKYNTPSIRPETKFYISTTVYPQNANFGQFLTGQKISRQTGLNNGDAYM